jgi:asparagine synthase (glutamine-hydrolysing)
MDQPTVDGMNTFIVNRAARQAGLTVALSGLGGDELFGGYATFKDVPRAVSLRKHAMWNGLARMTSRFRNGRSGAKLKELFERPADQLSMYLLRRELFLPAERRALVALPDAADAVTGLKNDLLDDLRRRSSGLDAQNRVSFFEIELYMRHMLLRDGDAFSMAAPVEYRVPFLDHLLVEAVFRLSGKYKKADPRPKPLLLDLVGPKLPSGVWKKPKRGFTFPWADWFRQGPLKEKVGAVVHDDSLWKRLNVSGAAVAATCKRFATGDDRISPLQILAFVSLHDFALRHRLSA